MSLALATTTPGAAEIFASVQGEGPSTGRPCSFIRLSRCNLACHWCDTPYTWHFEGDERPHRGGETYLKSANQVTLSETEAAERIAALEPDRLVITGGEPLLQGAALARMVAHLQGLRPDLTVEVETNGSVAPHLALDPLITQYNVSPKLSHSGNLAELALVPDRLAAWAADPRACFKFVIGQPDDVAEVLALAATHAIPHARIWLMAEGTDMPTLENREQWLAPLCASHGMTLSRRLHIQLFGDTRGT